MNQVPLPQPDADTAFFWEATARRELHILRCDDCARFIHPPRPRCTLCGSEQVRSTRVSGRGTVHSYTVTQQAVPGYDAPFAVVLVELEEQEHLRLVSQVTDVDPGDVRIGLPVEVHFVPVAEGVWLPMFRRRT